MRSHVSAETVRRCAHDPEAIEAVFRAYRDDVWLYAIRRARDPHEAADLVSEVFLSAVDSASSYDASRGTPIAWLLGIAARRFADGRRKEAREGRFLARFDARRHLDAADEEAVADRIDAERRAAGLDGAMADLSEGEREVLLLVSQDGLTPAEASQVLGISSAAARVRLSRARRRLKRAERRRDPSAGGGRSPAGLRGMLR